MKASIIVSNKESQDVLPLTISALCNQNYPRDKYEVILPDIGNFTREEKAVLGSYEREYPHFRILRLPGNRGWLVNEAVRQSKGELLLFIESHCLVYKDWLKDFVGLFRAKKIEVAYGKMTPVETDSLVSNTIEIQRDYVLEKGERLGIETAFFDFHNTAITRKCFEKMGGVSDDVPFTAEFELGARLHQKGIKIFRFNKAVLHFSITKLPEYLKAIAGQGRDKSIMLKNRDNAFMAHYFPHPKFVKYLSVIRLFRIPLLLYVELLLCVGQVGFNLAELLRSKRLAYYFFRKLAANSHRYGMLSGLK